MANTTKQYRAIRGPQERRIVILAWNNGPQTRKRLFPLECTQDDIDFLIAQGDIWDDAWCIQHFLNIDPTSPNITSDQKLKIAWSDFPWEEAAVKQATYRRKLDALNLKIQDRRETEQHLMTFQMEQDQRLGAITQRMQAQGMEAGEVEDAIMSEASDESKQPNPRGEWLWTIERHASYRDSAKLQAAGHKACPSQKDWGRILGVGDKPPEPAREPTPQFQSAQASRRLQRQWTKVPDWDLQHDMPGGLMATEFFEKLVMLPYSTAGVKYIKEVRVALVDLEKWYCSLREDEYMKLRTMDFDEWPVPDNVHARIQAIYQALAAPPQEE
ncbi:hypothetical protein ASPCAL08819 [Aspergillus calidoustus]|uniref:Uncharacterized protein n=1 Tax=Aspergillus calidoustus TaxID=454130 RepID=A0A0U5GRC4_ASPCI|nr:hypothetical protein ASPCAL08819 [Aspergillus calidoustus]